MKTFYVELYHGCSIVKAKSLDKAEKWAEHYFGASNYKFTREANDDEVSWNLAMGGREHIV